MNISENVTSTWNSPPQFQLPEQSSSSFSDRLIRLKTTYWNKGYAIVLLGFIGLNVISIQLNLYYKYIGFMAEQNIIDYSHYGYINYNLYGYYIGLIPGGILATVYPAHNILGIFVTITSIGHLIVVMSTSYLNTYTNYFLHFCVGTTMATADVSIDRLWTYWVPLNKQSIRHVPIVLYYLIHRGGYVHETIDKIHNTHSSYTLTLLIGVIGLVWYVLWLYVINGNYSFRSLSRDFILFGSSNKQRYSYETTDVSLTRSITSEIPWKSICTSKPVFAIALLYVCNARLVEMNGGNFYGYDVFEWTMRKYTIILLFLFLVLVELVPEITVSISTSVVRKFWSCSYFGSVGIFIFLAVILDNNTLRINTICHYMFKEMQYLYNFGFYVNTFDIAPKYASLLSSFLMNIHYISQFMWTSIGNEILSSRTLDDAETNILMAVTFLAAAVFYAIFASAEPQPWATDEPIEENQQTIVENDS